MNIFTAVEAKRASVTDVIETSERIQRRERRDSHKYELDQSLAVQNCGVFPMLTYTIVGSHKIVSTHGGHAIRIVSKYHLVH